MIFHTKSVKEHLVKKFKLNINKVNIQQVQQIKYLGVILDNKLSWQPHIQYVCSKLSKAAGIIFKLRKKAPRTVLLMLYNSLAVSYIRYGITSWGVANKTALKKLQVMQDKILRYITFSPLSNIDHVYQSLKIMDINQILHLETLKIMYKVYNRSLPTSFDEYFIRINHNFNTRTKKNTEYKIPLPSTDLGKQSIKYSGVKAWSSLDMNVKNASNYDIFKERAKVVVLERRHYICYTD